VRAGAAGHERFAINSRSITLVSNRSAIGNLRVSSTTLAATSCFGAGLGASASHPIKAMMAVNTVAAFELRTTFPREPRFEGIGGLI